MMRKFAGICGRIYQIALTGSFLVVSIWASAQDIKVNAGFIQDTIRIGEPTPFFLSVHYPSTLNVLFPDSTFGYAPFEYERREYFPTKTRDSVSVDSAVYYLSTFEVDERQGLSLPIFHVLAQDCTVYESAMDSISIRQLVTMRLDSIPLEQLPLKMDTAYEPVAMPLNYWILIIVGAGLLIIALVVLLVFGKQIRTYFISRRLKKKHAQFVSAYSALIRQLESSPSKPVTENALFTWKRYMEQLESHPYSKLTTKETLALIQDENLKVNLRNIDMAIYGRHTNTINELNFLRGFADQRFSKKLEEVKHAK